VGHVTIDFDAQEWRYLTPKQKLAYLKRIEKKSALTASDARYARFQAKYMHRADLFIQDCVYWGESGGPADYQVEIADTISENNRMAVRGPHGLGKTAIAALLIIWFALTRDGVGDWKIPTTASVWRQLSKFLWPEVRKWAHNLRWDVIGREPFNERTELLQLSLRLKTGEAFALTSDKADDIEGAHADHIMYVFDEAKAIPDAIWDSAEGALAGGKSGDKPTEAKALAISTPGYAEGRFYQIHARAPGFEDWIVRHVTKDETIAAGRMGVEWAEQRKRQWGEDSPMYKIRVLGEFATGDTWGLIPLEWVELAQERWRTWAEAGKPGQVTTVAVDVAGGGEDSDETVIARVYDGLIVDELFRMPRGHPLTATMETAGKVSSMLGGYGTLAVVDATGMGAGVLHKLREQRQNAWGFVGARKTTLLDHAGELGFLNWRAASWWILREMLDPQSSLPVALPPDEDLQADLTKVHWQIHSSGKIQIEGKENIVSRVGHSPDSGDAVAMALVGPLLKDEEAESEERIVGIDYEPVDITAEY